jgi:hypothetical protein
MLGHRGRIWDSIYRIRGWSVVTLHIVLAGVKLEAGHARDFVDLPTVRQGNFSKRDCMLPLFRMAGHLIKLS